MSNEVVTGERIEYFDDRWYKLTLTPDALLDLMLYHEKEFLNPLYLPSSTTALGVVNKPWLNIWRGDLGNELANFKSKKARDIGNRSHDGIHRLWLAEELQFEKYEQEEWVNIYRFTQWYESLNPKLVYEPEMTVYSLNHLYAGTLDFPVKIETGEYNIGLQKKIKLEGGIYIGDLKTGKSVQDRNIIRQLSSYKVAFQEMTKETVQGAFILHTQADTKTGWKMQMFTAEELDTAFKSFIHAKELWLDENPNLKPVIFDMPGKFCIYKKEAQNGI